MSNMELYEPAVLWIGDLQPHMTESYLNNLFKSCPGYLKSKVILNKDPAAKANYGFLFFKDHDDARTVITTLNGKLISGTSIKYSLNWGSVGSSLRTANDVTIYVGDLSFETTDTQLLNFFKERYPSVVAARINMDTCTHVSRGYAFVRFTNPLEAEHALDHLTGETFMGATIRVARAINRQAPNKQIPQTGNALYDNTQRLKQIYNHPGEPSPPLSTGVSLRQPVATTPTMSNLSNLYNNPTYQLYYSSYQQYINQMTAQGYQFPANYTHTLTMNAMQQGYNYGSQTPTTSQVQPFATYSPQAGSVTTPSSTNLLPNAQTNIQNPSIAGLSSSTQPNTPNQPYLSYGQPTRTQTDQQSQPQNQYPVPSYQQPRQSNMSGGIGGKDDRMMREYSPQTSGRGGYGGHVDRDREWTGGDREVERDRDRFTMPNKDWNRDRIDRDRERVDHDRYMQNPPPQRMMQPRPSGVGGGLPGPSISPSPGYRNDMMGHGRKYP